MGQSTSVPSSGETGTILEGTVVQFVPELRYVSDHTAGWYDAITTDRLDPSPDLPFTGVDTLPPGTEIEMKAAQRRLPSSRRGRFYLRKRQHERLVQVGAAYVFIVYSPRPNLPVRAVAVVSADEVDTELSGGWVDANDRGHYDHFKQKSWATFIDPDTVSTDSKWD